jgi:5'-deoxynucleotidase YfbR-like HD superfamily hydrolase
MHPHLDNYVRTQSGKKLCPFQPDPSQIDIVDIAAGLSKICRFSGQTSSFYSVAEHCMNVVGVIPEPDLKLAGLLHDASEAYLADVPKPLKAGLPDYQAVENKVQAAVGMRFGISPEKFGAVKKYDWETLKAEFALFFPEHYAEDIGESLNGIAELQIATLSPWDAECQFLQLFVKLNTLGKAGN